MNKNNGILFLALAAIGAGLYFMLSGKKTVQRTQTGTTGTNPYAPANSFAQLVGQRASSVKIPGSSSGASVDLSGAATAGVTALGTLAKRALDLIVGAGQPNNQNTAPGTSDPDGYGYLFDDYNRNSEPENSEGGGFVGPVWPVPDSVVYASPGYAHDDWGNQQWESTPLDTGGDFDDAYGDTYDSVGGDAWFR